MCPPASVDGRFKHFEPQDKITTAAAETVRSEAMAKKAALILKQRQDEVTLNVKVF
jgi:hypothetical protein